MAQAVETLIALALAAWVGSKKIGSDGTAESHKVFQNTFPR
jgi:hypothetical protein